MRWWTEGDTCSVCNVELTEPNRQESTSAVLYMPKIIDIKNPVRPLLCYQCLGTCNGWDLSAKVKMFMILGRELHSKYKMTSGPVHNSKVHFSCIYSDMKSTVIVRIYHKDNRIEVEGTFKPTTGEDFDNTLIYSMVDKILADLEAK